MVDGDPLAGITALGRLRRVVARGRDYVPDSGRFDVSAPGTPFASAGPRRRPAPPDRGDPPAAARRAGPARREPFGLSSVHALQEHERSDAHRDHDQREQHAEY